MIILLHRRWLKLAAAFILVPACLFGFTHTGIKINMIFWQDIAANHNHCMDKQVLVIKPEHFILSEFRSPILSNDPGRLHNLNVGVKAINRHVMMPHQTMSFNQLAQKCAAQDGWSMAKDSMVIGDELVDSEAGGVCQVSATLYNAGLLAGLKVVERHAHTLALNYVEPGRDAAIWFEGGQDLRLKNMHSFPVQVEAEISNNQVIVRLVTHNPAGGEWLNTHKVEIRVIKDGEIPYTTLKIDDPSLPVGMRVIELTGVKGYEYVKVKRIIKYHHEIIQQEILSEDGYGPISERVRVGSR